MGTGGGMGREAQWGKFIHCGDGVSSKSAHLLIDYRLYSMQFNHERFFSKTFS